MDPQNVMFELFDVLQQAARYSEHPEAKQFLKLVSNPDKAPDSVEISLLPKVLCNDEAVPEYLREKIADLIDMLETESIPIDPRNILWEGTAASAIVSKPIKDGTLGMPRTLLENLLVDMWAGGSHKDNYLGHACTLYLAAHHLRDGNNCVGGDRNDRNTPLQFPSAALSLKMPEPPDQTELAKGIAASMPFLQIVQTALWQSQDTADEMAKDLLKDKPNATVAKLVSLVFNGPEDAPDELKQIVSGLNAHEALAEAIKAYMQFSVSDLLLTLAGKAITAYIEGSASKSDPAQERKAEYFEQAGNAFIDALPKTRKTRKTKEK